MEKSLLGLNGKYLVDSVTASSPIRVFAGVLALDTSEPYKVSFGISVAQWLVILGIPLGLMFILWGGAQYLMARGEAEKINKAKGKLLAGVLLLPIVLLVFAILVFFANPPFRVGG